MTDLTIYAVVDLLEAKWAIPQGVASRRFRGRLLGLLGREEQAKRALAGAGAARFVAAARHGK